jgi:hypothetical protein
MEEEGKEGKTEGVVVIPKEKEKTLNKLPYQEREKIDVFHPVIYLLPSVMKINLTMAQ